MTLTFSLGVDVSTRGVFPVTGVDVSTLGLFTVTCVDVSTRGCINAWSFNYDLDLDV